MPQYHAQPLQIASQPRALAGGSPAAIALVLGGSAGLISAIFIYYLGFGLVWAAVVYFTAAVVFFCFALVRFDLHGSISCERIEHEIDSDLCSINQSKRDVSLL